MIQIFLVQHIFEIPGKIKWNNDDIADGIGVMKRKLTSEKTDGIREYTSYFSRVPDGSIRQRSFTELPQEPSARGRFVTAILLSMHHTKVAHSTIYYDRSGCKYRNLS